MNKELLEAVRKANSLVACLLDDTDRTVKDWEYCDNDFIIDNQ